MSLATLQRMRTSRETRATPSRETRAPRPPSFSSRRVAAPAIARRDYDEEEDAEEEDAEENCAGLNDEHAEWVSARLDANAAKGSRGSADGSDTPTSRSSPSTMTPVRDDAGFALSAVAAPSRTAHLRARERKPARSGDVGKLAGPRVTSRSDPRRAEKPSSGGIRGVHSTKRVARDGEVPASAPGVTPTGTPAPATMSASATHTAVEGVTLAVPWTAHITATTLTELLVYAALPADDAPPSTLLVTVPANGRIALSTTLRVMDTAGNLWAFVKWVTASADVLVGWACIMRGSQATLAQFSV